MCYPCAVELRVLGPLEVVESGAGIELGPYKQRVVLAVLLTVPGRVVSMDRLADELWPDEQPDRAIASLQAYVSKLRRLLEPERDRRDRSQILASRAPGWVLQVDPECIDAARFERTAAEGQALAVEGRRAEAATVLTEALALWRGSAYADFGDVRSCRAEAARLEELRLGAFEQLVDCRLDLGDARGVVPELEALVSEHPYRERFWAQLMLALYRSDRQADALRAYGQARERLVEELGVDPGPALRELESRILAQDPLLDPAPAAPTEPPPARPAGAAVVDPEPEGAAPPAGPEGEIVGRLLELADAEHALDRIGERHGRVVLVTGEPGIGKSRLAEEIVARAHDRGFVTASARGIDGDSAPAFWPIGQLVRQLLRSFDPAAFRALAGAGAPDLAQLDPALAFLAADGASPPPDPELARARLYRAVVDLFVEVSRQRPLLLVVDDLQWVDSASLQALTLLADELRANAIGLLVAFRDTEIDQAESVGRAVAALAATPGATQVHVGGLDRDDVGQLLAAQGDAPDEAVVAEVADATGGNPFFVLELARLLRSERTLGAPAGLPAEVREVIHRRLDRLPEQTRSLLTVAAVLGRTFDLATLEIASGVDLDSLFDLLEPAVIAGTLDDGDVESGAMSFAHDLVRAAIYDSLPTSRRLRLHARIGRALTELPAGRTVGTLGHVAQHLWIARSVVGPAAVLPHVRAAADDAWRRLAFEQAATELSRALELLELVPAGEERDHQELEVRLQLGRVLTLVHGYVPEIVGHVFDRAVELGAELPPSPELLHTMWGVIGVLATTGDLEGLARVAQRVVEIGERSGEAGFSVVGYEMLGYVEACRGNQEASRRLHGTSNEIQRRTPSLDLRPITLVDMYVMGHALEAILAWNSEHDAEASLALLATAEERCDELRHDFTTAWFHCLKASLAVFMDDVETARDHSALGADLCDQRGFLQLASLNRTVHGWARAKLGDPAGAEEADRAATETLAKSMRNWSTMVARLACEAHLAAGDVASARRWLERGIAEVEALGGSFDPVFPELVERLPAPEQAADG